MVYINGKALDIHLPATLYDTLTALNYSPDRVVSELNGTIIKKNDYHSVILEENDRLEVVTFVGGG